MIKENYACIFMRNSKAQFFTFNQQLLRGGEMKSNTLIRYMIRETMGLVVMGVALFWPAGTLNWWPAWAALVIMALWSAGTAVVILQRHPNLLVDRLGPRKGAKSWDLAIMSTLGFIQLVRYIVAGFDHRYGWTGDISITAQVAAFIAGGLGYALMVWSTAVNAFFSQIVRIQKEKGHKVVRNGPYAYLRHPGYFGALLFELYHRNPARFLVGIRHQPG